VSDKLHSKPDLPWWHAGNVTIGSKRKTKIKESNSWSSYWMDDDSYDYFYDRTPVKTKIRIDGQTKSNAQVDIARAGRLAAVRRAVSNFVRILTNDDEITVSFSSGQDSYTDGKEVVISAEDKPEKFDMLVGTALHESAHCVFSQALFDLMKKHNIGTYGGTSMGDVERFLKACGLDEELMKSPPHVDPDDPPFTNEPWEHFTNFKNVINFLEDRRIDKEVFHRAPGYRPYYQSMYDKLWNAKDIAKTLIRVAEMNEPTMNSYMFRLINLTNPATKYTLDRLPELDKIYNIVGLNKIRRLSHKDGTVRDMDLVECAAEIYNIILKHANESELEEASDDSDQPEEADGIPGAGMPGDGGDQSTLPNLDGGVPQLSDEEIEKKVAEELGGRTLGKADPNVEKLQEKQQEFLDGNTKKRKLSKKLSDVVSTMEESKTEVSTIKVNGTEYPYLRVQKLTDNVRPLLKSHLVTESPRYESWGAHAKQQDWVKTGCRLGQIIVDRIKVRHDRNETKFTRRPLGKIDRRLIYSLGVDNENVFFNKIIQDYQDSVIYLTIDCSSSMSGDKWKNTMILTTGLAYAAKKINNFDIIVNLRYGLDSIWSITMFDSRIDALTHFTKWMPLFHSAGYTPESIVYEIEEKFIRSLKTHDNNVYFITMTDGQPNYSPSVTRVYNAYRGFNAWEGVESAPVRHCKKMMKSFKEMNINILSYFIGHKNSYGRNTDMEVFKDSYGRNGVNVPLDNFSMISRSVNDLLIGDCEMC